MRTEPIARPARLALLVCMVGAGCSVPNYPGPQIQDPPNGFTLNVDADLERRMFPDREVSYHDAWVAAGWGNFSGIYINGHPGVIGAAEVEAARQAALALPARRPDQVRDFSEVERLTIDGREALAWSEMVRSPTQGIEYVAYRAVIPYDTVTFAVEMISGDPMYKARPDTLRTVVASFAVGEMTINFPLALIAAGALLLVASRVRARSRERAIRHSSITLKQVPKAKEGEGAKPAGAPEPGPAGPDPTAGAGPDGGAGPPPGPKTGSPPPEKLSLAEAIARQRERTEKGGR
ncbi:MAG: hypothetical protein RJQ04_02435 [Longimicrobiales bacterium]